jgi:hypothetical protein
MLDLLSNLSNVSTSFRQEVGKDFWKTAQLQVETEVVSDGALPLFLVLRPAIQKGTKSMNLILNFWDQAIECCDEEMENINSAVEFLAKNMEVQELEIEIQVDQRDLGKLVEGIEKFERAFHRPM